MNRLPSLCFAVAASLLGASGASGQPGPAAAEHHVAERILIQPRPGLSLADLDRVLQPHGGRRTHVIAPIGVHVISLPRQANAAAAAQALRASRHLKFAEVDAVFTPAFVPDDPRYATAWHLPKIDAPAAWDSSQGAGITIAILDSGVDTAHPDLQPQLVSGWNYYDGNADVTDVAGHGTTTAGVAAAAGNNGIGVASVAMRSSIMPLRVTDAAGAAYSSLIATALIAAADNGARVANLSFLGVSYSATIDSAAQYMRSKGGVVVAAGGNSGALRTDPVLPSIVVVAATDSLDERAAFSSWGDYIDVAAPGVSLATTVRGGGYGSASGTSVAAPLVAGVYALMMSARPDLPPQKLDQILFATALDAGPVGIDAYAGHGRVNAAAAVAAARDAPAVADSEPPTVAIASPTGGNVSGLVPVDVLAADNVGVAYVELYANGARVASDASWPYGFTLDTAGYSGGEVALQARAYDSAGNSTSSSAVSITVGSDLTAPEVSILSPANGATVSGSVTISVAASDDQRVAKIELSIDGRQVAQVQGASLSYVWNINKGKGKGAAASIAARAEDISGNATSASITVMRR